MRSEVELGRWGEAFLVDDEGNCGVTDCNGDRVYLEPDQWRRVIALLKANLPAAVAVPSRHQSVPGRVTMTFSTLTKAPR